MRCITWSAAVVVFAAGSAVVAQPVTYRTVIVTGDPIPGEPGTTFQAVLQENLAIDHDGRVAFGGLTSAPSEHAFIAGDPESLVLVARSGQLIPGPGSPAEYSRFLRVLAGGSRVATHALLVTPGTTSSAGEAIFAGPPGALVLAAREGSPAPGTEPGTTFSGVGQPSYNSAGHLAFSGRMTGAGIPNNGFDGLWVGPASGLTLTARTGTQAPGVPSGVRFVVFDLVPLALNPAGQIAFGASLEGPGVSAANALGLWVGVPGSLQLALRAGNPAPGAAPGVVLGTFRGACLNAAGAICVNSSLAGPGVTPANNRAIFAGPPGSVELVARTGEPAPGAPAGTQFSSFGGDPTPPIDAAGRILFMAFLTGPAITSENNQGLWMWRGGALEPVMLEGDQAAGLPAGIRIANLGFSNHINNTGGAAALSQLIGPGVTQANNRVLWALEPSSGGPRVIVRTGDPFRVRPGDVRTVSRITLNSMPSGPDDGRSVLNDRGEIIFGLDFTDNTSGVFIASLGPSCYANCDHSSVPPVLNVADFICFLTKYAQNDPAANCDQSTVAPILNVADFICFQSLFAAGCD